LLHRDVKAQNVMRDVNERHVLMDFGAGRPVSELTNTELTGTPLYVAPEVMNGENASPQSDVYSVGVLLFHLATGEYPIPGHTIAELRARHAAGVRVELRTVRPDVPRPLALLIDRALNNRAAERFPTAESMADAAARFLAKTSPASRQVSRQTVLVSAVVVALLLAA
jgi:serine/threonine protein kinase